MRTRPDSNQGSIVNAIHTSGRDVIECHNVPKNVPELAGFPDLLIVDSNALTVIAENPYDVIAAIRDLPGVVRVIHGAMIPVEVKTPEGRLKQDQIDWWRRFQLEPRIFRTIEQVLSFFGKVTL